VLLTEGFCSGLALGGDGNNLGGVLVERGDEREGILPWKIGLGVGPVGNV
jgi:hypothetical protein